MIMRGLRYRTQLDKILLDKIQSGQNSDRTEFIPDKIQTGQYTNGQRVYKFQTAKLVWSKKLVENGQAVNFVRLYFVLDPYAGGFETSNRRMLPRIQTT